MKIKEFNKEQRSINSANFNNFIQKIKKMNCKNKNLKGSNKYKNDHKKFTK
jgi:hypothetical protein